MTPLCNYHERVVTAAVQAGHMNEDTANRLAADLSLSCTPGVHCPPLTPPTQEQA